MVTVYCKNTGTSLSVQEGTMLLELVDKFDFDKPYPIISAKVNNVSEGLKFRVYNSRDVEFLDYRTYAGRNTYCRSLSFLLCKSASDVLPGCHVRLRRPVSKGYFCDIKKADGTALTDEDVARIDARMHEIVDQDLEFHRHDVHLAADLLQLFPAGIDYGNGVVSVQQSPGNLDPQFSRTDDSYFHLFITSCGMPAHPETK